MSFSEAFHPDNEDGLKTIENARYVPGKSIDGAEVGGDKQQNKLESGDKNRPDNKSADRDFKAARDFIEDNSKNEKRDAQNDHPTPEEILAQLNGSNGSLTQPKDSSMGGAQVAEGVNREANT